MISGFDTALGEITLVLFTTLAPSGALAFLLMGQPVLFGSASADERARINKFLSIPLVVSMIGLVASATHLGSPANALYVFSAVGSSPLSNEVLCAVIFLMLAGLYWLYSFSEHPNRNLLRLWLFCIDAAAIAFIVSVGFAYSSRTILSWNLWQIPVGIAANALVGGPLLALVSYAIGKCTSLNRQRGWTMVGLASVALAANVVVYFSQIAISLPKENSLTSVAELVPSYEVALGAFVVLAVAALVLAASAVRKLPAQHVATDVADDASDADGMHGSATDAACVHGSAADAAGVAGDATEAAGVAGDSSGAQQPHRRATTQLILAALFCLAAIFIMRFCFYMSHLTVGLGV